MAFPACHLTLIPLASDLARLSKSENRATCDSAMRGKCNHFDTTSEQGRIEKWQDGSSKTGIDSIACSAPCISAIESLNSTCMKFHLQILKRDPGDSTKTSISLPLSVLFFADQFTILILRVKENEIWEAVALSCRYEDQTRKKNMIPR